MQAGGGATGQAAVFGGRNGVVGLEFVKFDPSFKQRLTVFDVAGMDGGNVGRLEGVGQNGNIHAVVNQLFYGFNA